MICSSRKSSSHNIGTNRAKGYPFAVALPPGSAVQGVVLSDHIKSADWRERRAERISLAAKVVLEEVRAKLHVLLGT